MDWHRPVELYDVMFFFVGLILFDVGLLLYMGVSDWWEERKWKKWEKERREFYHNNK